MHCTNCGQEIEEGALRCSACHRFSSAFWLTIFSAAAWLAVGAIFYEIFARLLPVTATLFASAGFPLSRGFRILILVSNFVHLAGPLLILVAIVILFLVLYGLGSPKLGRVLAVVACLMLVSTAAFLVVNSHYLYSVVGYVQAASWAESNQVSELEALDLTHRTIAAEFRYRELHPKEGFTCQWDSLEPLGGPPLKGSVSQKYFNGSLESGDYLFSLSHCSRKPVSKYQLAAAPAPDAGYGVKVDAYCSDGSGMVYWSADGKAGSCLKARTPIAKWPQGAAPPWVVPKDSVR